MKQKKLSRIETLHDLDIADAAPLDEERKNELHSFCKKEGLSQKAILELEDCAFHLQDFERREKPMLQTSVQKSHGINEIARLANELHLTIEQTQGAIEIDDYWPNPRQAEWPTNISYDPQASIVQELSLELQTLSIAASRMHAVVQPKGKSGGRKETLWHYAEHIGAILAAVSNEGVQLARGGKFEAICNAVFAAAGVPSNSEGAIRYFLEEYVPDSIEWVRKIALKNDLVFSDEEIKDKFGWPRKVKKWNKPT